MGNVLFYDACVIDNELWFSNNNYNSLMKLNLYSNKLVNIGHFPKICAYQKESHRRIIVNGDELIFIPFRCKQISFFNRKSKIFKSIDLPFEGVVYIDGYLVDNELWLFPASHQYNILKYDLKGNKFEQLFDLTKSLYKLFVNEYMVAIHSIVLDKNRFFVVPPGNRYICEIDIATLTLKIVYEFSEDIQLYGITKSLNSGFLIWTMNTLRIYAWDSLALPRCLYGDMHEVSVDSVVPISLVCRCDEKNLILLPGETDEILLVNKDDKVIKKLEYPKQTNRILPYLMFVGFAAVDDSIIAFPGSINKILKISFDSFKVSEVKVLSSEDVDVYEKSVYIEKTRSEILDGKLEEYPGESMLDLFLTEVATKDYDNVKEKEHMVGYDIFCNAMRFTM